MSMNGDTQGQKDQIIGELTRLRQRFLSRINEYKVLLQSSISFFHSYSRVEEMLAQTKERYTSAQLPNDLLNAETMLKELMSEKESILKLLKFTSGEGKELIRKIGDQFAESSVSCSVLKFLSKMEEHRLTWERSWSERERALIRKIETCQIIIEKSQINRDLEMLMKEIETRRKNIGTSYELIQRDLMNFASISENLNVLLITIFGFNYLNFILFFKPFFYLSLSVLFKDLLVKHKQMENDC